MDDYGDEDKDPSAHQPIRKPSMRFRQSKNERKSKRRLPTIWRHQNVQKQQQKSARQG